MRICNLPKLGSELAENTTLLNAFDKLGTTWSAKFGLRKLSFKGKLPQEFSKMIDDIEITYNKKTYRLGDLIVDEIEYVKLGDLGSAPLGNIFDAEMESIISNGWVSGSYTGLSDEIIGRLTELKSQGYELIVKPQVSIGGKDPIPDLLFVKKEGADFILDDCIYIDNKYFHDVPFTAPQKEIVKPFIGGGTEALVKAKNRIYTLDNELVAIPGQDIRINKVEIFTVKQDFSLGKINKP